MYICSYTCIIHIRFGSLANTQRAEAAVFPLCNHQVRGSGQCTVFTKDLFCSPFVTLLYCLPRSFRCPLLSLPQALPLPSASPIHAVSCTDSHAIWSHAQTLMLCVVPCPDTHAICGPMPRPSCYVWSHAQTLMLYVVRCPDPHAMCGPMPTPSCHVVPCPDPHAMLRPTQTPA